DDDIAILSLKENLPSLKLSLTEFRVGEKVFVIGNPLNLTFSITDGIISRFDRSEDKDVIQFTAPAEGGSSGSPILNTDGEVIGVLHSRMESQGFNFGSSVSRILLGLKRRIALMEAVNSNLGRKCLKGNRSDACRTIGFAFENCGLLKGASDYYEHGCKLRNHLACERYMLVRYKTQNLNLDQFLSFNDKLCAMAPGSASCKVKEAFEKEAIHSGLIDSEALDLIIPKELHAYRFRVADPTLKFIYRLYPESKAALFVDFDQGPLSKRNLIGGIDEISLKPEFKEIVKTKSLSSFLEKHENALMGLLPERVQASSKVQLVRHRDSLPYVFHYKILYKTTV
ncbi:serine protease, partial [bacterium]|nr:serine protease [bacterium]